MAVSDVDRILAGLDDQQRAVVMAPSGPLAVLAGAGTGKTRAITHRIAYRVATKQIAANQTLAVTFTNKAATELAHRLRRLGIPGVQARTFHAAALRQLRYFWSTVEGSPLPEVASGNLSMIAEAARGVVPVLDTSLLRELAQEISWAKVSNVSPENYLEVAADAHREVNGLELDSVAPVLARYEQVKRRRGVIDFDDILLCAIGMLRAHPDVLSQVRGQYQHFTVDEYQDVSPVQRSLLELWMGPCRDVCVVGDVNQAIHTFAGAQPAYLLDFEREHPGALVLRMNHNYRSTPQILAVANGLVPARSALVPTREQGPRVAVVPAIDEAAEIKELVGWLKMAHEEYDWEQIGVLYRINSQAEAIIEALDSTNIPHRVRAPAIDQTRSLGDQGFAKTGVTLSTMHAAKGLEWEAVAVIGVSEGLVPFMAATTPAELAEERRLLYVALTRARTTLRISWATGGAHGRGNRTPSRYLRRAGLVGVGCGGESRRERPMRPSKRRSPGCRVCGEHLSLAEEIKLGRHLGCEVSADEQLFEQLRAWRSRTAAAASMPAFVVFTDSTLRAIAEQRPASRAEFLKVPGIGVAKLERYGDELLRLLSIEQ
ncbi:hypothetical protein HMPREF1531_02453 [Propionibacterium sp. oral taxon 192 str. F0372]|nr:hypothetical protein HMPREF1531_02453 [Propionibacterium sp. oral taxon 192 str. F0372]